MKKQLILSITIVSLFILSACSEDKPQTIGQVQENVKLAPSDSLNIADTVIKESIIEMTPTPEFETGENKSSSPNYFNFTGSIGSESIELILEANNAPELTGGYVNSEQNSFKILTGQFQSSDSIYLWNKDQDSIIEAIKIHQIEPNKYVGISVQGHDTLQVSLEKNAFTPSQSQFFINEFSTSLILTKSGIGLDREMPNATLFNTFYYQTITQEGFDTGEELITSISKIYTINEGFKAVTGEITNNTSSNEFTSQATIKVKVIQEGIKTEKEILFDAEDDNFQLYIFRESLIFIGDRTKKIQKFLSQRLLMIVK